MTTVHGSRHIWTSKALPLFLLILAFSCYPGCSNTQDRVDALVHEAGRRFAPDRTTAVFDITASVQQGRIVLKGDIQSDELKSNLISFLNKQTHMPIDDQIQTLPESSLGSNIYGIVGVSVANLRVHPGHGEEMATQLLLGTPVKILKRERTWIYVQAPDDYLGWTSDNIAVMDKAGFDTWASREKVIVTASFGFTTVSEQTNAAVVSDVVAGNLFGLDSRTRGGYMVEYPDGRRAFLRSDLGEPYARWLSRAHDTADNIVATARRFMGVPYLWGGTSTKAMDCSGFTKTVFFLNGVLLPRDAGQQAAIGIPVALDDQFQNPRVGDLLFFGTHGKDGKKDRVTHVGIYIGNKEFIHESGDVHINSLNPSADNYSEFRARQLLSARRIIGVGEESGVRRLINIPYFKGHEL